ncbi:Stk1 family PASTA domain-containing Ser/Thr kinase [Pseudoflavonifractor sp. MCC625]|uniref:Stk1 family PASTA domain-containing Ser/Thr kinase n=1 Tax=Pseudoflavonifractor sp. MCC625 TaxID=2592647 RepID=UPI001C03932F|nr:Stk1 family PASTA domain-containing Ser/Thr kinase [Pseudoflavonifractor sp. MCC625]MBT9684885.1 Stk1 family PASTA domain-containing Ser/Thr kinase [Pseudoflavonifractor sp. MCC625]
MDQYIGKLLDNRYEILERIGTGGMAVVYKARCHRLNRLVAIKILKEELAQDAEFRRRFHDESQAVAMLSHPNIMAVYDVSKSGDVDYIVMELLEGITLKQYMQKKGGKLSWKESLHFIIQIMKALSHAHSRGIIHRDIKPHNIMVLRDGSIKVADFGIARLTSASQNTMTQEALGSVHYISPEQARGSHIDARSDIYSAGVVLYEMLTGRLPYEGDSPVAVAIQHINSIPLSPRELEPGIPEALEAITLKAMASDVNQRYISADAMLADLEEFRKNPNINFEFRPEDVRLTDEADEPTQIIGANTPSAMTGGRRLPHPGEAEDATQRIPRHRGPESGVRHSGDTAGSRPSNRPSSRRSEDYYEEEEEPASKWPIIAAVGAILIFLVGIGIFLVSIFGNAFPETQDITIPDVMGYTLEEAQELDAVKEGGFTIEEDGEAIESSYPEGTIAHQSPGANTTLRDTTENRVIKVQLSAGSEVPKMLDLVNQEQALAQQKLKNQFPDLNLTVEVETEPSEEVESGYVIRTDPEAESELREGQTITLYVSEGKPSKMITIPSLIGQTLNKAQEMLKEYNLVVKVSEKYDDVAEAGIVIDQSINPNVEVQEGATLTLTVSKGPEPKPTDTPTPPEVSDDPGGETQPSSHTITISLPQDGREYVMVRVMVGDSEAFGEEVATSQGSIQVPVTGTGSQEVVVYIDGQISSSEIIDF